MTQQPPLSHAFKNPFTYGTMLRDPEQFVGRRAELQEIVDRLNGVQPQGTAVIGDRRIGKSSLLYYLCHPHMNETLLPKENMYLVYIDASGEHCRNFDQLRHMIALELLGIKAWYGSRKEEERLNILYEKLKQNGQCTTEDARYLFELLSNLGLTPVICLDEVEATVTNQFVNGDYNAMRNWANEGLLVWITASGHALREIAKMGDGLTSPFFNILPTLRLGEFTLDEVQDLANKANSTHEISELERKKIERFAGKHPYHLQICYSLLWSAKQANQPIRIRHIKQQWEVQIGKESWREHIPVASLIIIFLLLLLMMTLLSGWQIDIEKWWIGTKEALGFLDSVWGGITALVIIGIIVWTLFETLREKQPLVEAIKRVWDIISNG